MLPLGAATQIVQEVAIKNGHCLDLVQSNNSSYTEKNIEYWMKKYC